MATTYWEQLKNPKWQKKRLEIMSRDDFSCQLCGDGESTLNVHHKHYFKGRMAWDYEDNELITLCENCHDVMHDQADTIKRLFAKLRVDGPFCTSDAIGLIGGWADGNSGQDMGEFFFESQRSFILGVIAGTLDFLDFDQTKALGRALFHANAENKAVAIQKLVDELSASDVKKS